MSKILIMKLEVTYFIILYNKNATKNLTKILYA